MRQLFGAIALFLLATMAAAQPQTNLLYDAHLCDADFYLEMKHNPASFVQVLPSAFIKPAASYPSSAVAPDSSADSDQLSTWLLSDSMWEDIHYSKFMEETSWLRTTKDLFSHKQVLQLIAEERIRQYVQKK